MPSLLSLAHLIGLALGLGCATAKLTLLLRCRADPAYVPVYLAAARPLTRLIMLDLILLMLSGVGWFLVGYQLTTLLVVKLVLVAAILVLSPIIDNVGEPRFRALAPGPGESPSPALIGIQLHEEQVARLLDEAGSVLGSHVEAHGTVVFDTSMRIVSGGRP